MAVTEARLGSEAMWEDAVTDDARESTLGTC